MMGELSVVISIVVGIFAIFTHVSVSVWWASKITTTLEIVLANQKQVDATLGSFVRKEDLLREIKTADDVHQELARRIGVLENHYIDRGKIR